VIASHRQAGLAGGASAAVDHAPAHQTDDWPSTGRLLPWLLAGFLALLWFVPIDSVVFAIGLPVDATADRVALFALTAITLAYTAAAARGSGPKFRSGPPDQAFIAFIVVAILSVVFGATTLASLEELDPAAKHVGVLLIYAAFFYIAAALIRPSEVPRFAALIVGFAAVTAVGVIYEYRTGTNVFFDWSDKVLPSGVPVTPEPADPMFGRELINGPAEHAISAATMFSMALPFAVMGFLRSSETRDKILYAIATGLILGASFATIRKTGAVGMGTGLLVLFLYRPRAMLRLLPLGLAALVIIQFSAPGAVTRVKAQFVGGNLTAEKSTAKGRTRDYESVWPDILQHPVFGRGYGSYTPDQYRYLDNEYLQRLVETGIVGALAYLLVVLAVVFTAHLTTRSKDPARSATAIAIVAAAAVYGVTNSTYDQLSFPQAPYLLLFFGALAVVLRDGEKHAPSSPIATRRTDQQPAARNGRTFESWPIEPTGIPSSRPDVPSRSIR
jgi:polysaccharide biosynthesis protein PslJ